MLPLTGFINYRLLMLYESVFVSLHFFKLKLSRVTSRAISFARLSVGSVDNRSHYALCERLVTEVRRRRAFARRMSVVIHVRQSYWNIHRRHTLFSLKPRDPMSDSRVTRTQFLMDISAKIRSSEDKGREIENELGDEVPADIVVEGRCRRIGKISYRSDERIAPPRLRD